MNKDNIIEFSKDDITFYGNTEEERKLNELLFDSTMENDRLYQQLDKYKNVIDKIKEEIEIFNSVEYNANNFTILSLITRINELLEEVE